MRTLMLCVLFCLAATGCSRSDDSSSYVAAESASADASVSKEGPRRFMAYEHTIALEAGAAEVRSIHQSVEAACRAAVADECVILESSLNEGPAVYAQVKLRAKPAGIRRIEAGLATQGKVVQQSVQAEDLAEPIGDTTRRLKMLQDYREQLDVLRGRAGGDVESLIKVARELSDVQGQIEALAGEQAHLNKRVDTEILNVSASARGGNPIGRTVGSAIADFSHHFGEGVAAVITALAYVIPWAALLAAVWLVIRAIRSRRARRP